MCTANAIEMLAATRTPSRFVEDVRRDDPLTAECVGGHSRTLAHPSRVSRLAVKEPEVALRVDWLYLNAGRRSLSGPE